MSTTALRMSRHMLNGHVIPDDVDSNADGLPLGYLYSTWDVKDVEHEMTETGYYDEDLMVWVTPDGVSTMGVYTYTRTSGSKCGDCSTDDACQ